MKIFKCAEEDSAGGYSSLISKGINEMHQEMKHVNTTFNLIRQLEAKIVEQAKTMANEGDDYYGWDYLSQQLDGDLKNMMMSLEQEGNIFDFQGILRKYMQSLNSISRNMR